MTLTVALWTLVIVTASAQVLATVAGRQVLAAGLKLAPLIGLIGLVIHTGPMTSGTGRWFLAGLVLCALGDAFLVGVSDRSFLVGLGSFLLGHVAYAGCFLLAGPRLSVWAAIAVIGILPLALAGVRRILPGARRAGGAQLGRAVGAYLVVIVTMVLTAGLTGSFLLTAGALVFAVSDTVLGLDRFDAPRAHARGVVMATYYVGQILLTAGVVLL